MTNDPGLANAVLYNPRQLSRETLKAIFTAHRGLLDRLVQDLHSKRPTHQLIVGPRGMGKTTLLLRLGIAIEEDPALAKRLLPLTFPEEQYNVGSLGEFYLNCLDALADYLDKHGDPASAQKLDALVQELKKHPEAELVEETEAALVRQAKSMKRQFVLLVDNLSIIIDRLSDKEKWRLREWLSRSEQRPVLIAAAVKFIKDTADYGQALYEFLNVQELGGCDPGEAAAVLRELARVFNAPQVQRWLEADPARLAVLNRLAGGAPRTLVMLFQLLVQGMDGPIFQELDSLLDLATPLYKARFEELPDQAQRVVDALALHWDPITAGELAGETRLETNVVSAQLDRLAKQGVVEKVPYYQPETRTGFQIAERFFNIWYLMRANRRCRRKLIWLVEFLRVLYSQDELVEHARRFLGDQPANDRLARLRRVEFGLALAQAVDDAKMRSALECDTLRSVVRDTELRHKVHEVLDLEVTEAALKDNPPSDADGAPVWNDWGIVLREPLGRYADAEAAYRKAIDLDPEYAPPWFNLGKLLHEVFERYAEAEAAYRKAADLDPKLTQPWNSLGNLLKNHLGRYTEAEAAYRKEIELNPARADPWSSLGNLLANHTVRYAEAEAAYRKAIDLDPNLTWAWYNLGRLLQTHTERWAEAEAAYRKAIEIEPEYVAAWHNLALLEARLGRHAQSETTYRRALKLVPTSKLTWIGLGDLLCRHLDSLEEAEAAYRKAIELDPKFHLGWIKLGELLWRHLLRPAEAAAAYKTALELRPDEPECWHSFAWFLFLQCERKSEAEAAARKAVALAPQDPIMTCTLASMLLEDGDWAEIAALARQFLSAWVQEPQDRTLMVIWFFDLVVQTSHVADAVALLDEPNLADQYRPLREALKAIAEGTRKYLRRVAPEIRQPAEQLLDLLARNGLD